MSIHFKITNDVFPSADELRPIPAFRGENPKNGDCVEVNALHIMRNGRPCLPVMGEFHYSRYPREEWELEILKIKAGGIRILATYIFWNHHEEKRGVFNWSGQRDLRAFIGLCKKHGLEVALRIGPFAHGEARNGGLPDWLYAQPFEARSNDPRYLALVERLFGEIGRQASGFMFGDGGPVVAIQLENEFMDSAAPWETTHVEAVEFTPRGSGGVEHLRKLSELARQAGLVAPILTATGWGLSPVSEEEFIPVFGGYAFHPWIDASIPQQPSDNYVFRDLLSADVGARGWGTKFDASRVPYACCELGSGVQVFYKNRPVVPPESVDSMLVVALGSGANLPGFYVYHGGTNPEGMAGGGAGGVAGGFLNEHRCPRFSYDFQAPVGEFGQVRESYHRLRRLFLFLNTWGGELAPMRAVSPEGGPVTSPSDVSRVRCAVRACRDERVGGDGWRGFVFLNNYQDHCSMPDHECVQISLALDDGGRQRETARDALNLALRLKRDVCMILPFGMAVGEARLAYATVQPLTKLTWRGVGYYFFYAPKGVAARLAFERRSVRSVDFDNDESRMHEEGDHLLVDLEAGLDSVLRITAASGHEAVMVVLDDVTALRFWQGRFDGMERVVVSSCNVVFANDRLELLPETGGGSDNSDTDQKMVSLHVFPPLHEQSEIVSENEGRGSCGIFERHVVETGLREPRFEVESLSAQRALVRVRAGEFEVFDEIVLGIDYIGDVGSAYLNGRLVHDNFGNGQTWELGLRRFFAQSQNRNGSADVELLLTVVPARDGKVSFSADQMASIKADDTRGNDVRIRAVRATGRRRMCFYPDQEFSNPHADQESGAMPELAMAH
ncbi:beta-galactosidase [Geminisphaera colitermitum]|uniref:beta-galactosidase n=1 Tax=Geminisphaera colitermitum TaxID=1148786 RepID=UPI000158CA10|nr:beta-galactosidase [Geminisphaera colitermitum]